MTTYKCDYCGMKSESMSTHDLFAQGWCLWDTDLRGGGLMRFCPDCCCGGDPTIYAAYLSDVEGGRYEVCVCAKSPYDAVLALENAADEGFALHDLYVVEDHDLSDMKVGEVRRGV